MPQRSFNRILDEHLHILIAQGNHDAFNELRKRYRKHALHLSNKILEQYNDTGITTSDLLAVCESHFPFVIIKYVSGLSSFYSFWKETTTQVVMDYLIENSYGADAFMYKGILSLDQVDDGNRSLSELIAEKNEDKNHKRKVFEIRNILHKYDIFFTKQEKAVINLVLEGFTLKELEHAGLLAKSHLYLTYKSAVNKVQNYMKKDNLNTL